MAATSLLSAASKRLQGKVALITGGASGIGACTARVFAHHGAKVVIADIQDELGQSVSESIGPNCTYVHCDVTDESQVKNAVDKAAIIDGKLDIMFNNAGNSDEKKPRIIDNDKADFESILRLNVTGVFLGIKHASQVMIPRRSGCILSTASVASNVGGGATHAYACSKHAVVGLTKNAAVELGQFGIRVNCLSPFGVATPLASRVSGIEEEQEIENSVASLANLKHVILKAEDIANGALFLASDEGRYVSGHNILIDGGFSIANPSSHIFQYPEEPSRTHY
ncbi:hypothetical protein FNV43_RR15522 [Rhamnella rubrinervis]|uniref:Secoisolariciresinol dehydrogenase n=1 Tax=Rhamnella rubrinervis TaxID=2594499 RepID=A0A8K0ECV9_9ROSA|nr:hypothetical protein FNV43_RR15522 [Rhamnella rubrinervis]